MKERSFLRGKNQIDSPGCRVERGSRQVVRSVCKNDSDLLKAWYAHGIQEISALGRVAATWELHEETETESWILRRIGENEREKPECRNSMGEAEGQENTGCVWIWFKKLTRKHSYQGHIEPAWERPPKSGSEPCPSRRWGLFVGPVSDMNKWAGEIVERAELKG